jgi:hypothetical protein
MIIEFGFTDKVSSRPPLIMIYFCRSKILKLIVINCGGTSYNWVSSSTRLISMTISGMICSCINSIIILHVIFGEIIEHCFTDFLLYLMNGGRSIMKNLFASFIRIILLMKRCFRLCRWRCRFHLWWNFCFIGNLFSFCYLFYVFCWFYCLTFFDDLLFIFHGFCSFLAESFCFWNYRLYRYPPH